MLDVSTLEKDYGDFRLGPLDLQVDAEVLAVLGPSGCGKTTLLSLVAGLVAPDGGSMTLGGRLLDGRPPEDRDVGLVFQDGALFPHMTARENVAYPGASQGRVDDLAAMLEIEPVLDRPATALSGGERQRVALARALASDPAVLLLDEPLTNLDAPIRRRLRAQLDALFESLAIPIVYVTHDQRTATALGDRVTVLRDGRIVQSGRAETVFEAPRTAFVARFVGANVLPGGLVDRDGSVAIRPEDVRLGGNRAASVRNVVREAAVHRVTLDIDGEMVDALVDDPPPSGAAVEVEFPEEHLVPLEG